MATTFENVADIIADTSEIDRDAITPDSHTIDDLGIDSLDFLDIVFASRDPKGHGLGDLSHLISYGGSPRASISLANRLLQF